MFYFNTLPKILTPDENGDYILMTNLVTRAKLQEQLKDNPLLFYEYAIQDGDTPEIVAEKYYDDAYRYWIVLLSNEILDPLWSWPLTSQQFLDYIDTKYATDAEGAGQPPFVYANTTIKEYQKIITTKNTFTEETNITKVVISQESYNTLNNSTTTYTLPDSTTTIVTIEKKALTIYEYEEELNNQRRQIKILSTDYVSDFERIFESLMEVR